MKYIFETLKELRNLSGNTQISELSCRKSDLLKQILEYTYDPHRKFKIDEGKLNKFNTGIYTDVCMTTFDWYEFVNILDYLKEKKSASDDDVRKVCSFINKFNEESQVFLKQVLFKDLRLNMAIKKFQKVWPNFCVEPQVQLAQMYEGQNFENGYYSRKFDGKRMYILDGIAYSRANKPCKILPIKHILQQLQEQFIDLKNYVLDGEVLYIDNSTGIEDFQKGISLTSSDERTSECDNLCYVIFDMIDRNCFVNKQPDINFSESYVRLCNKLRNTQETGNISFLPTIMPNIKIANQHTSEDYLVLSKTCKDKNWEGLMYRNGQAPYEYKRTKNLLKIKSMYDGEFTIVGMEEGTGKNIGKLGAIVIDYKGYQVKVGSGFSDIQREVFWNMKDTILNTQFTSANKVKVQYFEETTNAEGNLSLRFPVFLAFRNIQTGEEFVLL